MAAKKSRRERRFGEASGTFAFDRDWTTRADNNKKIDEYLKREKYTRLDDKIIPEDEQ